MFFKTILYCCLLVVSVSVNAQRRGLPNNVIFDSDMGPDYDDVGALTLLHAYADSGYCHILATVASTKYEGVAAVLNSLNTYFNRPDISIGVPKGKALEIKDFQHWTDTLIAKYPHKIKTNDEVPGAVEVYRKMLASVPDRSVTIITVGFLTNLSDLLKSSPDKYSTLDGKALVRKKVKQLVCMAGGFPSGKEFNIKMDAAASKYVFDNWETPVLFSGVEIGWKIKTGLPLVNNEKIKNSPVKDVFSICTKLAEEDKEGRSSWDQTAVMLAIKKQGIWWNLIPGKIKVTEDGSNTWSNDSTGHFYIAESASPSVVQEYINTLMMQQPVKR